MNALRVSVRASLAGLIASSACVLADVSLEDRACPCAAGWVCRDGVCVTDDSSLSDGAAANDDAADGGDGGALDGARSFECPASGGGPALVPVDTYCIDRTEVTVADYRAFIEAGVAPSSDPPRCAGTTAFTLEPEWDGGEPPPDVPAFVKWCEAYAFCKWAGKRLCGAIDGGAIDVDAGGDRARSQWLHACTGPSGLVYPYGNDTTPDACAPSPVVVNDSVPYDALTPVNGVPACEGAYPGLFGMTGNGAEWIDECPDDVGCVARGSSACRDKGTALISAIRYAFRCCAP